ncbi:hypothetical protein ELS19_06155 [Halogeometricum borinquense]|uniref:Uncharacterized protein n=1 Tax=Halogeometricum borinquense TaxID=60847 RepID=A0A482TNQ7_9EURY|nr:hypothetical protein [Halogeometricum borinquense]RYJ13579.1 hypothetical protein ELS19_06155 [Halogeometricum borinquense]
MKGNIWTVAVTAIFLGVMLQAADLSYDSGAGGMTGEVAQLLGPLGAIIGVVFVVSAAGAFITIFSGGSY